MTQRTATWGVCDVNPVVRALTNQDADACRVRRPEQRLGIRLEHWNQSVRLKDHISRLPRPRCRGVIKNPGYRNDDRKTGFTVPLPHVDNSCVFGCESRLRVCWRFAIPELTIDPNAIDNASRVAVLPPPLFATKSVRPGSKSTVASANPRKFRRVSRSTRSTKRTYYRGDDRRSPIQQRSKQGSPGFGDRALERL